MKESKSAVERLLPIVLPLLVLLAAFFFCLGGRFIPVIGSYY